MPFILWHEQALIEMLDAGLGSQEALVWLSRLFEFNVSRLLLEQRRLETPDFSSEG